MTLIEVVLQIDWELLMADPILTFLNILKESFKKGLALELN